MLEQLPIFGEVSDLDRLIADAKQYQQDAFCRVVQQVSIPAVLLDDREGKSVVVIQSVSLNETKGS